jgi:hypothetical protein
MPKSPEMTAADYLAEAERVRRAAEVVASEDVKRKLLDIAADYEGIARSIEENR